MDNTPKKSRKDYLREWKKKHPEKVAAYNRKYMESHRDQIRETYRRWAAANRPPKYKAATE